MNRRGHMSHKVPNVKLRPASSAVTKQKSRYKDYEPQGLNAMDEETIRRLREDEHDEEDTNVALRGTIQKPWIGVVITFTGVENKPALTTLAKELGANVESALTISVTHVVASGFGSPKYLYAVKEKLPVMAPSWISSAHERWLGGEELDFALDMDGYRLQPFLGLKIALSGIEPLDRRRAMVQLITDFGGIHSKDLDRECTHLVSSKATNEPRPSEKVKWAVRELKEREASRRAGKKDVDEGEDIKIVHEQWIWDCIGYRGRWKEDGYDARKPRSKGKVDPEDVLSGKIFEEEEKAVEKPGAEDEHHEPAVVKKRKRPAMDSLVGEIFSTTIVKAELIPVIQAIEEEKAVPMILDDRAVPLPVSLAEPPEPERKPSMLHLSRDTSFAAPAPVAGPSRLTPVHADPSFPSTIIAAHPVDVDTELNVNPAPSPMFYTGYRFSHVIEESCGGLEKALTSHGGILITEEERLQGAEVDYVIMRLCSTSIPPIPKDSRAQVVTECWVEGCCFEQRWMDPSEHPVFRPPSVPMPIRDASKLSIHLSGFGTAETVYLKRVLKLIGAELSTSFHRRNTSHLVCGTPSEQKYQKSLEWNIPAVRDTWLFDMYRTGEIQALDGYRYPGSASGTNRVIKRLSTTASASNMSAVSELTEPVDFGRLDAKNLALPSTNARDTPSHLSPAPKPAIPSQHYIASSRKLGLTPTHIDDIPQATSSRTHSMGNALSPPKVDGTERLLNQAVFAESIDARLARTSSAPAGQDSLKPDKDESLGVGVRGLKAATASGTALGSAGSSGQGRRDMTDMLKKLAEGGVGDISRIGTRIQRRPRPINNLKHGAALNPYSPMNTSVSPSSNYSSPPHLHHQLHPEGPEESMRINFVDPVADREARKLRDAVNRGSTVMEQTTDTPRKRSKVGR